MVGETPLITPASDRPSIRGRVVRAVLRAAPAVLIAAGIWIWFEFGRRDCDERVRAWSATWAVELRRGERELPPPARISEWIEPTLRGWLQETPTDGVEVRFVPADPQIDSKSPSVEWAGPDGSAFSLRCRCTGDGIEIVGVTRR